MNTLRFRPISTNHSIDDFFLGIRFARQLSDPTFTRAVVLARGLAKGHNLPAENQQVNFMLAVDPAFGMQTQPSAQFGTYFQRFNELGGVDEELRLERNFVGYRTSNYDRWHQVTDKLETMLLPVAQIYAAEAVFLETVVLQYVDRFLAAEVGEVDWSELFRPDTPWVASGIIPTKTAWHSHCGRFEGLADQRARRLVNVNVDVAEPTARPGIEPSTSLSLLTLCTDHFARPGMPPHVIEQTTFLSDMRSRFENLHDRAKEILKEVLADAYVERIGMKTASHKS